MAISRYDPTLDPSINPFLELPSPPKTVLSQRMCGLLVLAAESFDPTNPGTNPSLYTLWEKYVFEDQHREASKSSFFKMVSRFHRVLEHGDNMPSLLPTQTEQYRLDSINVAIGQTFNRILRREESTSSARVAAPSSAVSSISKKRALPTRAAKTRVAIAGVGAPARAGAGKKRVSHTDKMCAILVQANEEWDHKDALQDTAFQAWVKEYTLQVETESSFQSFYNLIKQMRANDTTPIATRLETATPHMQYIIKEASARLIRGCSYIGKYGYPYPRYTPPSKRLHT